MRAKALRPFLSIFLLITLVSLACSVDLGLGGSPTAAPTQTAVIEPTQTEPPEQPPSRDQPPATGIQSGQPDKARFFTEDFDEDLSDWSYFLTSGEKDYLGLELNNGYLIFDLPAKGLWVYALYDPYLYTDVRIEVRAENRGTNNNNISMICRYDIEEGWYEVNVTNGGLYNIMYGKWDNSMKTAIYTRLADGGSTLVKAGKEINNYTFVCRGRTLFFSSTGRRSGVLTITTRYSATGKSVLAFHPSTIPPCAWNMTG